MKLGVVMLVGMVACGPSRPVPVPVSSDECDAAEQRLSTLGCREARSPSGRGFADICRDVAGEGVDLRPRCIADAVTCAEVRTCR
mgnify:FL=1